MADQGLSTQAFSKSIDHQAATRGWNPWRLCTAIFKIVGIGFVFIFFLSQFWFAAEKPFWGDEMYGLETGSRVASYIQLLTCGVPAQGSTAPLDYIVYKFLDQIRLSLHSLGLPAEVYYRLWGNISTAGCALIVLFFFWNGTRQQRNPSTLRMVQVALLGLVPAAFLFSPHVYYYAAEMRPYAAWNSLWFLALAASLLYKRNSKILAVTLIVLAFSATAAVFQIGMMMIAFALVNYLEKKSFKEVCVETLKIFGLPVLISIYYCLKVDHWDPSVNEKEWNRFFDLWAHESRLIPLMLAAIFFCLLKKENRFYAVAPLTVLLLYLAGPVIVWVTFLKGFFFTERQYIYYDLTHAVLLLIIMQCLPAYLRELPPRNVVLIGVIIIVVCFFIAFRPRIQHRFEMALRYSCQLFAYSHSR